MLRNPPHRATQPGSQQARWAPGPRDPHLGPGAVHVWLAELDVCGGEELVELLSTEENARASSILEPLARECWKRAHAVLRALLARYLERDPRALRFGAESGGKPVLISHDARAAPTSTATSSEPRPPRAATLSFNMSHSRALALYAVSGSGAVGVDLEVGDRDRDEVALAARIWGAGEARRLQALEPAIRAQEFLRQWTAYEARLKCVGGGLGGLPNPSSVAEIWVGELYLGERAAGALAAQRAPRELRRWAWT